MERGREVRWGGRRERRGEGSARWGVVGAGWEGEGVAVLGGVRSRVREGRSGGEVENERSGYVMRGARAAESVEQKEERAVRSGRRGDGESEEWWSEEVEGESVLSGVRLSGGCARESTERGVAWRSGRGERWRRGEGRMGSELGWAWWCGGCVCCVRES